MRLATVTAVVVLDELSSKLGRRQLIRSRSF
jgi:hypothetical protein